MQLTSSYTCLEKHDTEPDQHWFYALLIQPTLFGDWSLLCEWGRVGSAGQIKVDWHTSQEAAEAAFGKKLQEKRRCGYV